MQIVNRLFGRDSNGSRTRSSRRGRTQLRLETLEGRELMSVANYYGQVGIQAEQSGSTTSVQKLDNGTIEVVSDGQKYDFAPSTVTSICFIGSFGGGDTFLNGTGYTTTVMTYTGN